MLVIILLLNNSAKCRVQEKKTLSSMFTTSVTLKIQAKKKNELKGKMNKISRKKHGSNQKILMRLPLSFYDSESDAYVHNLSSEGHLEL